ncbi:MAG: hypothetical protein J0H49_00420 [Acidobacteria bacterium]|nr:hypothetical protein [Acidobacteriota bacterium]
MPTDTQNIRTLHTWKEIAAFLGVSVRAAQMWERDAGLPVRRPPGEHGHVTANPEELSLWASSRQKPTPWWRGAGLRDAALWIIPFLLVAILGHDLVEHHGLLNRPQVASVLVNGRVLSALDDQRHEVWRAEFEEPLDSRAYIGASGGLVPRWIVEDLDEDGDREVVFVEVPAAAGSPHRLHVFDSKGATRWSYPPRVHDHLELVTALRTIPAVRKQRAILVHFCGLPRHEGAFNLLSARGQVLTQFQHGGHLDQLAVAGDVVLLGGECNRGKAAEIHKFRITGGESITLRSEGEIQFTRSCVNRLLSRANRVSGLAVLADGYLITVAELIDEVPYEVYHEMNRDLTSRRCWASDAFHGLHRRLEIEGRLKHQFTGIEEADLCRLSSHGP